MDPKDGFSGDLFPGPVRMAKGKAYAHGAGQLGPVPPGLPCGSVIILHAKGENAFGHDLFGAIGGLP